MSVPYSNSGSGARQVLSPIYRMGGLIRKLFVGLASRSQIEYIQVYVTVYSDISGCSICLAMLVQSTEYSARFVLTFIAF